MKVCMKKRMAALIGGVTLLAAGSVADVKAGEDLKISGFVDVSYFDQEHNNNGGFGLDQIEIDIEKKIDDRLSARVDINYLPKDDDTSTPIVDESKQEFDDLVEQGYVTYAADLGGQSVDFSFGKFNIPMGFELLDPVDMYQYSHTLIFDYGIPTNVTGLMASTAFSEVFDLSFYLVNGWDNNRDDNNGKTIGGRFGITPAEGINVGLSGISGKEDAATDNTRTVFDLDFTITAVDKLTLGGEYNMGEEEKLGAGGADAEWTAYMLMANYALTDTCSLTLRYDSFDDEDGIRLPSGIAEERESYTIAALHSLGEGAGVLAEYRIDKSDKTVFSGEDDEASFAVEFTYAF